MIPANWPEEIIKAFNVHFSDVLKGYIDNLSFGLVTREQIPDCAMFTYGGPFFIESADGSDLSISIKVSVLYTGDQTDLYAGLRKAGLIVNACSNVTVNGLTGDPLCFKHGMVSLQDRGLLDPQSTIQCYVVEADYRAVADTTQILPVEG